MSAHDRDTLHLASVMFRSYRTFLLSLAIGRHCQYYNAANHNVAVPYIWTVPATMTGRSQTIEVFCSIYGLFIRIATLLARFSQCIHGKLSHCRLPANALYILYILSRWRRCRVTGTLIATDREQGILDLLKDNVLIFLIVNPPLSICDRRSCCHHGSKPELYSVTLHPENTSGSATRMDKP